ncbi:hypothetical protein [Sporosarcina sp. SAFN-015]|uniref:hypothetical protein n=1 Tax=Sporosarcina sp. SAFN-015 TaxID=3387274 RepID=UPI003F80005E
MITVRKFLETFICKAGESIHPVGNQEWEIQKWTARTFKTLGNVLASTEYDMFPAKELVQLGLKPKSRRTKLPISDELQSEALQKGWLIQEIRFKPDGRTPASIDYRMGPGLYEYERRKIEEDLEADRLLTQKLLSEINASRDRLPQNLMQEMERFALEEVDSEGWGKERIYKFTHFLIAFLQLKKQQNRMEYKEIGATYYRRIGGSKEFDTYKEAFIARIEKWIEAPISEVGIVSTGSIVPIFFTGNVTGEFSTYSIGVVHATTDIAVSAEEFRTTANVIWLVENRAILTRMATELTFLWETSSIVLGIDGQVRGAHRKMIQQLCRNSSIEQIIIWVDYDAAGIVIARELASIVDGMKVHFVGTDGKVFGDHEEYSAWVKSSNEAEQEMTLGGPAEWKLVINQ